PSTPRRARAARGNSPATGCFFRRRTRDHVGAGPVPEAAEPPTTVNTTCGDTVAATRSPPATKARMNDPAVATDGATKPAILTRRIRSFRFWRQRTTAHRPKQKVAGRRDLIRSGSVTSLPFPIFVVVERDPGR